MDAQLLFHEYVQRNLDSTFFYTDGSCLSNQTGAAAVGPNIRYKIRLQDHTTIFSAEVHAIQTVVRHIQTLHIEQAIICTDSKSALQALERTDNVTHYCIQNIHKMLLELDESQHITFLWVPSHCGIAGNELADTLAKEGAMRADPSGVPLSIGDVCHKLRTKFNTYLQNKWNQTHSPHLYAIKQNLTSWTTCNQPNRIREVTLARLRCGHTRFTHCHLFERTDPPICQTCNTRITVEHILIGCTALRNERKHINNHLTKYRLRNDLPTLLGDDPALTDLVLDFVLNSPYSDKL